MKLKTVLAVVAAVGLSGATARAQRLPLAAGVEKVCTFPFKDEAYPARVEGGALSCLEQAAKKLRSTPDIKLVLIGVSHPVFDHEEKDHGMERTEEDPTGADIRFEDVAAYRAVNTKQYLTRWYGLDPERIIPTTDEYSLGRAVFVYAVPADADFKNNYLKTTPINEKVCTVKPCPPPKEDILTPQEQPRIQAQKASANN